MTSDEPLFKIAISLDLNILLNIWDNVNTQVSKIYNTILVIFEYFNKKILHIVPLITYVNAFTQLVLFLLLVVKS